MLCDNKTCRKRGMNRYDSSGRKLLSDSEFCSQLRHIKCKVAHLARKQIQKKITVPNYDASGSLCQPRCSNTNNARMAAVSRGTTYRNSNENINVWALEDKGTQSNTDDERANGPVDINDIRSNVGRGLDQRFATRIISDRKLNVDNDRGRTFIIERDSDHIFNVETNGDVNSNNLDNSLLAPEEPASTPKSPMLAPGYANFVQGAKTITHWTTSISKYCTKQLRVLLVAVIIGILMWMALVYGAILGASLCTNGQLPSFQFGSSRTRVTVF